MSGEQGLMSLSAIGRLTVRTVLYRPSPPSNVDVDAAAKLSRRTDRRTDGVTDRPKSLVGAQFSLM